MKKFFRFILNYGQILVGFLLLLYLRSRGLDISNINDLGLLLAATSTMSIIAGFLNRISDDWAGFTVVAVMIYALVYILKMKFFMIGIPASIALICVFYIPSGMNLERIKQNAQKKENTIDITDKQNKK